MLRGFPGGRKDLSFIVDDDDDGPEPIHWQIIPPPLGMEAVTYPIFSKQYAVNINFKLRVKEKKNTYPEALRITCLNFKKCINS